jgi:hypothetical protein
MRTFPVLICSLALACAARGDTDKKTHTQGSQHAATHSGSSGGSGGHVQQAQPSHHPAVHSGSSASSGANVQHVVPLGGPPTSSGQRFEQTKGSQNVVTPRAGPRGVGPAVQPQPEIPASATTAAQPAAPALTQKQLDEAHAQSQGFRSAEQYRKWKETGRVEIPAGVATSRTPTAVGGPGSVHTPESGVQVKADPFRPQHFSLPSNPTAEIEGATFQQNSSIQGSQNWQGSNYTVFRNYSSQRHDRNWWHNHCSRVVFVSGGWYAWNAGCWYPAWGYAPNAYYAYNGPIYTYNNLPPDQAIANVQAALQALGYYHGPVNGILGPVTRVAIANYQRDHGLYITAAIDESTLASLGMV